MTSRIYSNSERSEQFLKQNAKQLPFKSEKMVQKPAGKVRKYLIFSQQYPNEFLILYHCGTGCGDALCQLGR